MGKRMYFPIEQIFSPDVSELDIKNKAAEILKTTPEALEAFEKAYQLSLIESGDNKSIRDSTANRTELTEYADIISRIVSDLLNQTEYLEYDGQNIIYGKFQPPLGEPVSLDEIGFLPKECRPQLTGDLVKKDITKPAYPVLIVLYDKYLKEQDRTAYHIFRQGLDIIDLDPVIYRILGMNCNSMSFWLPKIVNAVQKQDFFKIPKTRIVKVPMSILQMTRLEYGELTQMTKQIIDDWAMEAFNLDVNGDYFIKTGTFSSKFDFRNARVTTEKEVKELGEYLVFLQNQAVCMAGPLNESCYYGVSTTNEFVVREFIPDVENNPTIYQGLPLRTEYRFFVDFDTKEILGVNPYWDPDVMKDRFSKEDDANTVHMKHDYIIYKAHEEKLMSRYNSNVELLYNKVRELLSTIVNLTGQWSLDIMQNGNDFYIIDMADAYHSALQHCVPEGKIKLTEELWLPEINFLNPNSSSDPSLEG